MKLSVLLVLALVVGLMASTEVFAYLARLDPTLGVPLWRWAVLSYYAPWDILKWAWWWGYDIPQSFILPGLVGLLSAGLACFQETARRQKPGQAHWATPAELRQAQCRGKTGIVLGWTGALWWRRLVCYSGPLHCFFVGGLAVARRIR